jgi:hypothetical protein
MLLRFAGLELGLETGPNLTMAPVDETLAEGEAADEVATASTDNAEVGVPVAGAQGAVTVTIVASLLRGITARAATVAAHNRNENTFIAENECGGKIKMRLYRRK